MSCLRPGERRRGCRPSSWLGLTERAAPRQETVLTCLHPPHPIPNIDFKFFFPCSFSLGLTASYLKT